MKVDTDIGYDIANIINYEKNRYVKKGYGLTSAIIITITFFVLIPRLAPYLWPYRIENEGKFFFTFIYIIHETTFILANLVLWIIYKIEIPFFERYKANDKPWPWKEDPIKWYKLLKETILVLIINQGIILPLFSLPVYLTNKATSRLDYDTLPSSLEVTWQIIFFMVIEDFTFYWGHRFLHWDRIYPYIHKLHHKYQNSVSIASEFAHPVEFLFSNLLTTNLGPILLGRMVHGYTYAMWIILRLGETTDGHSGYEFSWSPYRLLPMSAGSEYHNYHHLTFKGNYSSFFTYMDFLCGTINNKYKEFKKIKKELIHKQKSKSYISKNE